jgi:uncharacterized alkaline shock family protein YloU
MSDGKTIIYDDVFVTLARIVLESADEVFYQEKKGNFSQFFGDKNTRTGILIRRKDGDDDLVESGSVSFEIKLSILYGVSIPEALRKIREVLASEVKNITGFNVETVDITVERIIRLDKADGAQPDENDEPKVEDAQISSEFEE